MSKPDEWAEFWRSSNPPWGVVRAVVADDEFAIVLDDLNGDYCEVELLVCRCSDGEWDDLFTLDDHGLPDEGEDSGASGWVLGFDGHYYCFIYGRDRPGAPVTVTSSAGASVDVVDVVDVVADSRGWWLRVVQDDDTTVTLRRS